MGALTFFIKFQSTRPLRGATFLADIKTELEEFQSTRPLRGATTSAPAQEPEINEADGEPIYHDPGEEGDGDE